MSLFCLALNQLLLMFLWFGGP